MMRAVPRSRSLFRVLFSTTTLFYYRPAVSLSSSVTSTTDATMTDATTVPSVHACIVGGGCGGCAAASSLLSSSSSSLDVMLLEMGRGVGGRASTRFSREDKRIAINHGAPHAEIQTPKGRALLQQLQKGGFAQPSSFETNVDEEQEGDETNSNGKDGNHAMEYWTGNPTMNRISEGLLGLLPDHRKPQYLFRSMVRQVEPIMSGEGKVQGWRLKDKDGTLLVETEWLIVAGSGMAHPRWTAAFGGDPPLLAAAQRVGNQDLNRALATIGSVHSRAVQAALMAFDLTNDTNDDSSSILLQSIESGVLETPGDPVLEKLVFQKNEDNTLLSVVAHSNAAFAESAKDTYGSRSTAARVGGATTSSADREQEVLDALMEAVKRVLVSKSNNRSAGSVNNEDDGSPSESCPAPSWGPLLHRWGNAFPEGSSLPIEDAIVEDAKVAFCGDYVGTQERFGTFEGALLSGHEVGKRLQQILFKSSIQHDTSKN